MQKGFFLAASVALAGLFADDTAAQTRTGLDIYVVDVEGGNATLLVAPSGESLLIDTGNVAPEAAIRDAGRILAATQDAHLTQIDHLIITHWHNDHFGGVAELAKRIPIKHFIDHGANVQPAPAKGLLMVSPAAVTTRTSTPATVILSPGLTTLCLALA